MRRSAAKTVCRLAKTLYVTALSRANVRKTSGLLVLLVLVFQLYRSMDIMYRYPFATPATALGGLRGGDHSGAGPRDGQPALPASLASPVRPAAISMPLASSGAEGAQLSQAGGLVSPAPPAAGERQEQPVWVWCASLRQTCNCPGRVRWGVGDHWATIDLEAGKEQQSVDCSPASLTDVAPGKGGKHCLCESRPGTPHFESLNPGLLPTGARQRSPYRLVASCNIFESAKQDGAWGAAHWQALEPFCSEAWAESPSSPKAGSDALKLNATRDLMRAWVDWEFVQRYEHYYGVGGWVDRAFVNYYAGEPGGKHATRTEELVKSVHLFSSMPIVVVHFGVQRPIEWTPQRFPQLVLLHAAPMPSDSGRSFNFNKLRALLLARVRTGVELDSDQFVAPGVDAIFHLTEREVTEEYAMPILPVHFLNKPWKAGKYMARFCPEESCEFQTLRWGHAHPTWTFWAAPWIGKWLRRNLRDETLRPREEGRMVALRVKKAAPEDEDLLNIALWEDGGVKQWCKFDVPNVLDFEGYLGTSPGEPACSGRCLDVPSDQRWHPHGVPRVFFTAHDAKDPEKTRKYVERLKHFRDMFGEKVPPNILYHKRFYKDGEELRAAYPGKVNCLI